jgi:ABC-type phosphate transport system substrate-binding protein
MKRSFLSAALMLACLGLASAGCSQTGQKETTTKSSKPADPTAWTDSDVSSGSSTSQPKSSRLSGGWSSEARDIERAMGVGQ